MSDSPESARTRALSAMSARRTSAAGRSSSEITFSDWKPPSVRKTPATRSASDSA